MEEKKLYLLFSVDVIDSTAMKSRMAEKNKDWFPLFKRFYLAYPKLVTSKSNSFKLWKYIGDEILFYIELNEVQQIPTFVKDFINSLNEWNSRSYEKIDTNLLNEEYTYLKGCVWIAQVPKIDRHLQMDYEINKPGTKQLVDFAGPSIDCGFRIAKFSTQAHLVISLEVLCACLNSSIDFYFLTSEKLKGVYNERVKYPIFFTLTKASDNTDDYLREKLNEQKIKDFLIEFYKQFNSTSDKNLVNRLDDQYFHYFKFGYQYIRNLIPNNNLDDEEELDDEEIENHISEMKEWFLNTYEDPAESCPFESREGGYFYLKGGPYNAEEELSSEFGSTYPDAEIQRAAEELEQEHGVYDWERIESIYEDDE